MCYCYCFVSCFKVDCGDGVLSYGRRRKRSALAQAEREEKPIDSKMMFDPNLKQEVIFYATPLRKQIRVESGTKVDEVRDSRITAAAGQGGKQLPVKIVILSNF